MKTKNKRKKRGFRVGDTITCSGREDMERVIRNLAREGIDCKPVGYKYEVEILDIERKRK